jgi:hypothetical protein
VNIRKSTELYETWLGKHLTIIPADLEKKHAAMSGGLFPFLRATFYRWMQCWPEICEAENEAPQVLSVGDLHVENFGTWRDAEGRLIWGVNDFDEAYALPYTQDLTRVATSAHIAIQTTELRIGPGDACDAILEGYVEGIQSGGRPFVLEEHHEWLRETVTGELRKPARFWAKFDALKEVDVKVPAGARKAIERLLPSPVPPYRMVHRIAGLGSLGRERFAAIVDYDGGKIAREAKALAPSACAWAAKGSSSNRILYERILGKAVRAADPFMHLKGRWIVRRLSPHCCRIELTSLPAAREEKRLLQSMGYEVANIHLGTAGVRGMIERDLKKRDRHWLHKVADSMMRQTARDWDDWRKHETRTTT